jgi:HEAT repeat protein
MAPATRILVASLLCTGLVAAGLAGGAQPGSEKVGEAEEKVLKSAGIGTDNDALLNYLKLRSLKDADRSVIEKLVKNLDSNVFSVRDKATKELVARGKLALPFLKKAIEDGPLEVVMRAKECLQKIEKASASEQPATVARLLALRNVPGAVEALLNYAPSADDPNTEEEVLHSMALLAVHGDKIDPVLVAALKDQNPDRRAAVAYLLGLYGSMAHREVVRQLLADPDAHVQSRAAAGLVGKQLVYANQEGLTGDLAMLKAGKIATDGPGLLQFLQKRTLSQETQKKLEGLVKQLGDTSYKKREQAAKDLIAESVPALPFLKQALDDADLETQTRARKCIQAIKSKSSPTVAAAAVRVLAQAGNPLPHKGDVGKDDPRELKPAAVIATLLAYVPFADDESVEEEVINALTLLSVRESKVDTALVAALTDPLAPRRGAAAIVLGKVGTREQAEPIRKLLKDAVAKVQFRAAQGLIAAQDRSALPTLVELFPTAPDHWVWQVEEQLSWVAGNTAPLVPPAENTADYRKKAHTAWSDWVQAHGAKVELTGLGRGEATLGLFTIVEYDSFQGNRQGKVWECGRDGKPRWQINNLFGAMDGRVLSNGHVLVAENSVQKISERDQSGKELWTFQPQAPPVAVQRLPNGNTFIAMYDRVMEITADKQVVYNTMRGPQMFMYGAQRLKNGHIAAITAQGQIVVFDPVANRDIKVINLGQPNGWCGIDVLPNGRYLVSLMNANQVREVDDSGKVHWQANFQGVFRAIRLPNGNTLACSMTTRKVAEIDRNGVVVWDITCDGRPWSVHYR